MKRFTHFLKVVVFSVVASATISGQVSGPVSSAHLVGSKQSTEESVKNATVIVVAKLISLGRPGKGGIGSIPYRNVQIEIVQPVKGDIGSTAKIQLFRLLSIGPEDADETLPEIGKSYIFILKRDDEFLITLKILDSGEASLALVTNLLSSSSINH